MRVYMISILPLIMATVFIFKTIRAEDTCICLRNFTTQLRNPIHVEFKEEGYYVAEQRGVILFYENEKSEGHILLNITSHVFKSDNPFSEQGLLGFTLHPRYTDNGRLYVFYMAESPSSKYSILGEFTAIDNYADKKTERFLLRIDKTSHAGNGGQLLFGRDGFLYISVGDGVGDVGKTQDNAQDPSSLLGKILRIDVDSQSFADGSGLAYGIPPNNPFYNTSPWRREVFAYGCRDMFRCSQDIEPDENGEYRIFCGDPGARSIEEINLIRAGGNYGWNIKEGLDCYDSSRCNNSLENEELPIHVYKHTELHHAVVGGHVYRGSSLPFLAGRYVFGDALDSSLTSMKEENSNWTASSLQVCDPVRCACDAREQLRPFLLAFSQDLTGEMYVLATQTLTPNIDDGVALKMVPPMREKVTCAGYQLQQEASLVVPLVLLTIILIFPL